MRHPQDDNSQVRRLPHGKILRVTRRGLPVANNPFAARIASARTCTRPSGDPGRHRAVRGDLRHGLPQPVPVRPQARHQHLLRQRRRPQHLGGGQPPAQGTQLRLERPRGLLPPRTPPPTAVPPGYTNPIHAYRHRDNCRSVTGGAFVPDGLWPGFDDAYLYADFACGRIFRLDRRSDGTFRRAVFLRGAGGPTHLRFGPYDDRTALYYLSFFGNEVHRVTTARDNTPPVADLRYTPDGRTVTFDGSGSYDPDAGDAGHYVHVGLRRRIAPHHDARPPPRTPTPLMGPSRPLSW